MRRHRALVTSLVLALSALLTAALPASAADVRVSGVRLVKMTCSDGLCDWGMGLDSGAAPSAHPDVRVQYGTTRNIEPRFLFPYGGARMGKKAPTFAKCDAADLGLHKALLYVEFADVTDWMCVRTDDGRLARVQLYRRYKPGPEFAMRFVTWEPTGR